MSAARIAAHVKLRGLLVNIFAALVLMLLTIAPLREPPGDTVIRQMYERYRGAWPTTFTFEQRTTLEGGAVETWYEAGEIPGKLRIDIAPLAAGRALLFRADSLYAYRAGRRGRGGPLVHPLLLLLYDMHVLSPDTTIARLRSLGFDLSKTHLTSWEGRAVTVIGATAGDTAAAQIWVESERLLPVRVIQSSPNGLNDDRIGGYVAVGSGWGERRVESWVNGRRVQLEEYSNVRTGVAHEAGLFDPVMEYRLPSWIAALTPK